MTRLLPIQSAHGHILWLTPKRARQLRGPLERDAFAAIGRGHGQVRVRACSDCGGTSWRAEEWRARWCGCGAT